jgi:hypothetical protein
MFNGTREVLKTFFFPPPGSTRWQRILPYLSLGILSLSDLTACTC